jgi:hypothetical protein
MRTLALVALLALAVWLTAVMAVSQQRPGPTVWTVASEVF